MLLWSPDAAAIDISDATQSDNMEDLRCDYGMDCRRDRKRIAIGRCGAVRCGQRWGRQRVQ